MNITFIILIVAILLVLLALSGLISGSEVAFFSFSHDQVEDFEQSDKSNEKRISFLLNNPRRLLATILIVNNLVNIFIVTISTFATWKIVGKEGNGGTIAILTAAITVLIVFFGEIIPKVYANNNGLTFAKLTSGLLMASFNLLKPFSWFLLSTSNLIEKRMKKKEYNLSLEEVNHALEISVQQEKVSEEEKGILKGIVNFGTLSVTQVMKSRMDITAIDIETDFHELMNQINKTGYSRMPVFAETVDKIEGILYIKDLIPHLDKDEKFEWQKLLRPAYFVPESKKIDDLFKDFQEKHVHIALVVDEYGGTSGLITMEDVIEEIVGEINDEFDDEMDVEYKKIDENTYSFEGKTSINDFCKITDIDNAIFEEAKGESESLGGLILELNHKIPNTGEIIEFQNLTFTVTAVDKKRIKKLKVFIERAK